MSRVEELKAAYETALREAKAADAYTALQAAVRADPGDAKARAAYRKASKDLAEARSARRAEQEASVNVTPEPVAASAAVETPAGG
jgi:hypothetical protein